MIDRLIARATALGLSAVVTFAMLASVNLLATPEPVATALIAAAALPVA
jgi:hypothetical protein